MAVPPLELHRLACVGNPAKRPSSNGVSMRPLEIRQKSQGLDAVELN